MCSPYPLVLVNDPRLSTCLGIRLRPARVVRWAFRPCFRLWPRFCLSSLYICLGLHNLGSLLLLTIAHVPLPWQQRAAQCRIGFIWSGIFSHHSNKAHLAAFCRTLCTTDIESRTKKKKYKWVDTLSKILYYLFKKKNDTSCVLIGSLVERFPKRSCFWVALLIIRA